jgi:hypothetical protein
MSLQNTKESGQEMPDFLETLEDLRTHLDTQFEGLSNNEKGNKYEDFVRKVIPFSDIGERFSRPTKTEGSYDKGVDLYAEGDKEGDELIIQAKYTLTTKKDIDSIVSHFEAIDSGAKKGEVASLFDESEKEGEKHYVISAPRKLDNIIKKYRQSTLSSLSFFRKTEKGG